MKGVLLWTERPERLPREEETHAWMEANHPEREFDLELIYDNQPGDWRHYSLAFHAAWRRAAELGVRFINLESDVVPTREAFRLVTECEHRACTVPYALVPIPDAWSAYAYRSEGHGTCQVQAWEDVQSIGCDLGFVQFSASLVREMDIDSLPHLRDNSQCLNAWLYEWLRDDPYWRRQRLSNGRPRWDTGVHPPIVDIHWLPRPGPAGLLSNHREWDEGDRRHHRREMGEDGTVLRLPPGVDTSPRPTGGPLRNPHERYT